MGLEFDQLNAIIGTVTAATKQSGDEVGNFVKNVLPRLIGGPAQKAMDSIGVSLTDGDGNIRDVVDVYTEIATKIQDISDVQRVAVVEGLAGKYHISRMDAFLTDLASADSMYRSMYESSTSSAGSANRENEIFMQSLQARINLVRVEFEKLAITIGEVFLTDAMIEFLKGAGVVLQLFTSLVNMTGVLGTVMGVFGFALVAVSRRFRDFATSIFDYGKDVVKSRKETEKLADATKASGDAADVAEKNVNRLGKAWKTFLVGSLVGIGFYVVGKAIEFVIGKLGEAREKAEEVEAANKELMDSYKNNADQLETLAAKYSTLSDEIANSPDPDTETLAEYYDIQNQIADLMPSLITGETQYGEKIIGSADSLRIKLDLLKEQLEIEKEAAQLKEAAARDERIDTAKDNISTAKSDSEGAFETVADLNNQLGFKNIISQEYIITFRDDKGNPIYDSPEKLSKLLDELKQKQKTVGDNNPELSLYYETIIGRIQELMDANVELFVDSDNALRKNTSLLKSEYIPIIEEAIYANNGLTESNKEAAASLSAQLINAADLSQLDNLKNGLETLSSQSNSWQVFDQINGIFDTLNTATADNFTVMAKEAGNEIDNLAVKLLGMGLTSEEVEVFTGALENRLTSIVLEQSEYNAVMEQSGMTMGELQARLLNQTNGIEGLDDSVSSLIESFEEFNSVAEELSGISQKQVDETEKLLLQYEMLNTQLAGLTDEELESLRNKEDLTIAEELLQQALLERDGILDTLIKLYPDLVNSEGALIDSIYEKISAIREENKANELLLDAYDLLVEKKLSAEESATVITAMATKERIDYYKAEIAQLNLLYQEILKMHEASEDWITRLEKARIEAEMSNVQQQIETEMPDYSSQLERVDDIVEAHNKTNEATKKSVYVANEYEQALEKINYQIQKQLNLQKQFPEHSKEYQKSLQEQIKLEKEKLALQEKQSKELGSQIKSGQIKQYGNISSSSESTNVNLSGWSGVQTQGYKGKTHRGTDLDGYIGERIDANINGKVVASGKAKSQGYDSSYGTIVVIEDSNGFKHLYAHLNEAIAKIGETISAGTQIGTIGNTGNVIKGAGGDGSHLHYEVTMNGVPIDPSGYINDAKNNLVNYTSESLETVSSTEEAIDKAKSELIAMNGDVLDQKNVIAELEYALAKSYLAPYEKKKSNYDQSIENSNNRLEKADPTSDAYRLEIEKQINTLKLKKQVNQDEMKFLKNLIQNGKLSAKAVDELTVELHELGKINSEIDFAIEDLQINRLESVIGYYEKLRQVQNNTLDSENLRLQELDTNSKYYVGTLEKIKKAMEQKQKVNNQELLMLKAMINNGNYHGDVLEQLKIRYQELTLEIQELTNAMHDVDYEVVINIKTRYDEEVDDIQHELDRLDVIKGMYDEGSGDYNSIVREQIRLQDELTATYKEQYNAIQQELRVRNLQSSEIKQLEEDLENLSVAYWQSLSASKNMTKELAEIEKRQKEEIADKLIESYKAYIQQRRDEHMRALDAERAAEERRHQGVIKNYERELEAFRRATQDKLDLLDEEEATRTYDMDIDELSVERDEVAGKLNLLRNDDSLRAKAERKELQEQLDEIDKEIADKRYERDLQLRRDEINKKLEEKEEEIGDVIDFENEKYDEFTYNLDRQRDAWEAHYDNLLNDEREFARIREEVMNENFEAIKGEFGEYIQNMSDQMPILEGSMDAAMKSVGNSIRMNVIDALTEAIQLMADFENAQVPTNVLPDGSGSIIGGSGGTGSSSGSGSGSSKKSLTSGDQKVILGKFMAEDLVGIESNPYRVSEIKRKASALAAQGRTQGSKLSPTQSLDSILSGVSKDDLISLGNYVSNAANSVVESDYLQDYIKDFAERILRSGASLSTGGMIPSSFSGKGIDGKGGRSIVVHPEEIINNPLDAKRLLSMANVLEKATMLISPIISKLPMMTRNLTTNGDQYVINFGDVHNTTAQEAQNFAKEILNNIRVKKGGK